MGCQRAGGGGRGIVLKGTGKESKVSLDLWLPWPAVPKGVILPPGVSNEDDRGVQA